MNLRRRLLPAVVLLVAFTALTVVGYRVLGGPHISLLDSLYMAVITIASVGYGEIIDTSHSPALRAFNTFVVLVGVAVTLYVFSVVTAFFVEGEISHVFGRRRMQKRISELKDHYIVCGLGATGRYVVEELLKTSAPFVVIESHEDVVHRFIEHHPSTPDLLYLTGDVTDEELLDQAGLQRARGLVSVVSEDKDNLVVTVMVRQKNPNIRIVARCVDAKFSERLIRAGANATVSPNSIGGLRMASELLRPHVVSFLDLMLKEQSRTLRIEDIEVPSGSDWCGKRLSDLNTRERYDLMVLAVKPPEGGFEPNPPDDLVIGENMVLIVMGHVGQVARARHDATPRKHKLAVSSS